MKNFLLSSVAAFGRDRRATIGMIFGFSAVPIMLTVTAAYDYTRAVSRQTLIQNIVDQAVLSALSATNGAAPNDASTRAMITAALSEYSDITLPQSVGGATASLNTTTGVATVNLADGVTTCVVPAHSTPQTSDCSNTVLTYTAATSSTPATYKAVVTANAAMSMMAAFGASVTLTVSSTAEAVSGSSQAPSSATFNMTGASGYYWKQVDVYIHNAGASSDTDLASYVYQPTNESNYTGTLSASILSGTQMVAGTVGQLVSLGNAYDTAYMTMTVYSDGCGPGMAPDTTQASTSFSCVATGTQVQSGTQQVCTEVPTGGYNRRGQPEYTQQCVSEPTYTTMTKTATPVVYSTKNATQIKNLFVQSPTNTSATQQNTELTTSHSLVSLLPACGQLSETSKWSWEDTPYNTSDITTSGTYLGSWAQQDIKFDVTTNACEGNSYIAIGTSTPATVRLAN